MAFNPDQYLAEKTGQSFDPDKYLAEKTGAPSAPEGPSGLESAGHGLVQGATLGFGDELGAGLQAGLSALSGGDARETYRQALSENRQIEDRARAANPDTYAAGKFGGGLATGLAATALTGGTSLGAQMALGGGQSALNSLGEAEHLDRGALKEAALAGALGAGGAAAGYGAGKAIGALGGAAQKVGEAGVANAEQAIAKGAPGAAHAVKDVLKDTAKEAAVATAFGHPHLGVAALAKNVGRAVVQSPGVRKAGFGALANVGKAMANPGAMGHYASVLSQAAARGPDALNAAHFVLGNSDPEYQRRIDELPEGE